MMKIKILSFLYILFFLGCDSSKHEAYVSGIEKIGDLRVLVVQVAETLHFKTKNSSCNYLVVGYGHYAIDFKNINPKRKDADTIVVGMPPIKIKPIVDYKKTRSYAVNKAGFVTDKKINGMEEVLYKEAPKLVKKAADQKEYYDIAKRQAEAVIKKLISAKVYEFEWKEQ